MLSKDPRYLLISFGAIAVVALGILLGSTARYEYRQELAAFEERLQTEARLLAEHARLSIAAADLVIAGVEANILQDGMAAFTADPARWRMVRESLEHTPQLTSLMVVDAKGRVQLTTTSFPPPPDMNVADRPYFQAHLAGKAHHIGAPITGRGSGRRLIPVSIRLEGPGEAFEGVVVAAMDIAYFQAFYTGEPQELDRRIGMYLDDGTILSLYPAPKQPISRYLFNDAAADIGRHHAISFVGPSPLDGSHKVIAFRHIDTYPVSVSVGADLARFRTQLYPAWSRGGFAFLAFTLGTAAAVFLLYRSMQNAARAREQQLELARRQREAERLSLAVIQHIPNGWVAIVDREARYVFIDGKSFVDSNPPSVKDALGKTLYEVYPSAASRQIEACIDRILTGSQPRDEEQELELPFDRSIYKVIIVPLADENERVEHILLVTQDITELKEAQLELEERNRQLQELSFKDSLLGVANRRAFDQALAQEWRRALRQQQPLALLMVDVDHFKLFNDTYGHTAGDECLRRIAEVLGEAVSRPGDMVARYGGEEFAVLLPEANLDGALYLARHIHSSLAAAAIPFPDSPAADGVITVCIGAAALLPRRHTAPVTLVEEADAALYRAKKDGRNRTATAPESA